MAGIVPIKTFGYRNLSLFTESIKTMNTLKYLSILSIFLCTILQGYSQVQEKPGSDIWEMVQLDTFPYLRSLDGAYKTADVSLLSLFIAKNTPNTPLADAIAQAYYYNLLVERYAICDSIILSIQKTDTAYINLLGHMALRDYVPCFGVSSPACDSIRMKVYPILKEASIKSELMPKDQWKWLYQYIDTTSAFAQSQLQLLKADDSLQYKVLPSWEGGILAFKIKEGKQNLLISNGVKKPIQILELDSNDHWKDITASTNLDIMPGGHSLYNIDYNNDGLDDLFILRKSSNFKSPATYRSSLLMNKGDGTFEDVTFQLGLDDIKRPNCACWSDINGDGKLDVFIGNEFISSAWMVQNEDGIFENQSFSYNVLTNKKNVMNCLITDLNGDNKKDLLLSLRGDSNIVYIQDLVDNQYIIFKNKTDNYDIKEPVLSQLILPFNYSLDGKQEILIQSDYNDIQAITADVLNGKDTIDADPSYFMIQHNDTVYKTIASPEVSLIRAGVVIENFENILLLGGGGKNTESLYPMIQYQLSKDGHQISISTPENWPAYVHSMTAYADSLDQPILVVKGGGNYPFMVNRTMSYQIKMPESGKFVRLFDYSKSIPGSTVEFDFINAKGKKHSLLKTVKPLDSKGFNALQEWFWVADGTSIKNIIVEEKSSVQKEETPTIETPSKKKKDKKKKKSKK